MSTEPVARRPGRPPQTDEEAAAARRKIIEATAQVFGESGYHGTSVARIVEVAGIARPTFYRYYRNSDEAVVMVLLDCGRSMAKAVGAAANSTGDPVTKVLATIDAYLAWGAEWADLLQSLHNGMHDPSTIVAEMRPRIMDLLGEIISAEVEKAGRRRPDPENLDLMLTSFQYACYRLHLGDATPQRIAATRDRMTRMALGLIGEPEDWRAMLAFYDQI